MTFSQNWEIRLIFTKVATMVGNKNFFFFLTTVEHQKTPPTERNISKYDIIQDKQFTTEKCFFFVYHKLDWDMK